jgi:hypothetical protein
MTISFLFSISILGGDQNTNESSGVLKPYFIQSPIKIDGILDEDVWKNAPTVDKQFLTSYPAVGNIFPQKTLIWVAYDSENIYFAFHCSDTDPSLIKTTVTKRDNITPDDWVTVHLDTVGNRQFTYDFYVNPDGIQQDEYSTSSFVGDTAPDFVWYSASKMLPDGYSVEIQLPLKNFRYSSGEKVQMNIMFRRKLSRTGENGSWPFWDPGKGLLNCIVPIEFEKLANPLKLEVLPAVTYSSRWDRISPSGWSDPDDSVEFGVTAKVGLTSSINAEVTINPDFSQVESDAFQVLVNQRYPVFYSEKRPFFMDASALFTLAGSYSGFANMQTPVHTRLIANPSWGAKVSGETGMFTFGLLASSDEVPVDGDTENAGFWIGRGKLALGGDSFFGLIYSGREFGNEYNRVIGTDIYYKFAENHDIQGYAIYSFSNDPLLGEYDGLAYNLQYTYSTQSVYAQAFYENWDDTFRMDTSYYRRTGISTIGAYVGPYIDLDPDKITWLKRIAPYAYAYKLHDFNTDMDDTMIAIGGTFYTDRQGSIGFEYQNSSEAWAGQQFDKQLIFGTATIRPVNWLSLHFCVHAMDSIYYESAEPFLGTQLKLHSYVDMQLSDKIAFYISHLYDDFNRKDNGEKVYDLHIINTKLTYHFSESLFLRAIVQWDSLREVVLTDILASFTYIPGTVIYLGYGSLHENMGWEDNHWNSSSPNAQYYQSTQSIFLKASYLFQN